MEWINSLVALIGVVLGWLFSQYSEYFKDKKADKRKLRKLLFYLLELRYLLYKELNFEIALQNTIIILKKKTEELIGEISSDEFLEKSVIDMLKQNLNASEEIVLIENNIDNIIRDLSEIDPVFAYELSGRYKIKERILKYGNYIKSYDHYFENAPSEIKDFVQQPFSNSELLQELDIFLIKIGKRISKKTGKDVEDKLAMQYEMFSNSTIEEFVEEFLNQLKTIIEKSTAT